MAAVYRTWCSKLPMLSHPTRIPSPAGAATRLLFLPADGNHRVMRTCPVSFSIACAAPGRQPVQCANYAAGVAHADEDEKTILAGGSGAWADVRVDVDVRHRRGSRDALHILLPRRRSASSEYTDHISALSATGLPCSPVWSIGPVTVLPCFKLSKPSQPSSLPSHVDAASAHDAVRCGRSGS